MPGPTRIDTVAWRFSDQDIMQRVASRLSDGSMAWKVDIIGGLTLDAGDINIGAVNILNAADVQINPGTEETLLAILAALGGGAGGASYHDFATATSVPSLTPTTVLSYLVPVGKTLKLSHVVGGGNLYAKWFIKFGNTIRAVRRAADGGGLEAVFNYTDDENPGGFEVPAGTVLNIVVEHNRPWVGDFEAEITGRLL